MNAITQFQIMFIWILSITEAGIVVLGYRDGTYFASFIIGIITMIIFLCIYGIGYEALSKYK